MFVQDAIHSFSQSAATKVVDILVRMPLAVVYVDGTNEIVSWNNTPLDDLPAEVGHLYGRDSDGSIQWQIERFLDHRPWYVSPELHTRLVAFRLRYFELSSSSLEVVAYGY